MTFVNETTFDKIKLPEKIYKYRNWTNAEHRRLLTENEIYFSPPNKIDEQHECNLETDYDSVTNEMIYKYAYQNAWQFGITSEAEKKEFATLTMQYTPFHDKAHRVSMEERFHQDLNRQLSIFCVSEHRDNINLWSSFAGGQTGFCVGIDTRKMFDNKEIFGGGGKVDYYPIAEMPKRKAFCFSDAERVDDMLKVIFSLPDFFAQENEYRLFKMNLENKQAKIGQDSIVEIILGYYMDEAQKKEITSIGKERFPKASVLQTQFDISTSTFNFIEL